MTQLPSVKFKTRGNGLAPGTPQNAAKSRIQALQACCCTPTQTQRGCLKHCWWRGLLTHSGFRVAVLRSSNKEGKGLCTLEMLVGISLLMGWHNHSKLRKALLILGWVWGRESEWFLLNFKATKQGQCLAVPTLIAALCSETWKYPIIIPVSSLWLGAMMIVC